MPTVNDQFGRAVAGVGDRVLVGARLADVTVNDVLIEDAGAAYLFDAETGQLLQTYVSPTPTTNAQFGYSVAAMGENVLVGVRDDETGSNGIGAVYLFDGETTNLLQRFVNPAQRVDGQPSDFGRTVAAAGDKVLVGARWDDTGEREAGTAFLFDSATGELVQTFTSPTPAGGEEFGFAVAATGDDVLVSGAWDNRHDGVGEGNGGAAYLYEGATGRLLQVFANPVPGAWDAFGVDIAADEDRILIGSQYANAAYLFEPAPVSPTAVAGADGNYRFSELGAGTYRVVPLGKQGYVQTMPANPGTYTIVLADDSAVLDLNFAFAADQLPVARDDHYTMTEDSVLTMLMNDGILGNDTDADGDTLTAKVVHRPPYGDLTPLSDGSFQYRPHREFAGSDSFTYRSHDGVADSHLATVTISVQPVNDVPVADDDGLWVAMNTPRLVKCQGC